jgi:hypothetical protein
LGWRSPPFRLKFAFARATCSSLTTSPSLTADAAAAAPGELHQRVLGHRSLCSSAQRALRDQFLTVFEEPQPALLSSAVSIP